MAALSNLPEEYAKEYKALLASKKKADKMRLESVQALAFLQDRLNVALSLLLKGNLSPVKSRLEKIKKEDALQAIMDIIQTEMTERGKTLKR